MFNYVTLIVIEKTKGVTSMKHLKTFSALICLTVLLGFSVTAYAASKERSFTYNFKHQLAVSGSYSATKSTADFSIFTTSNGGKDTYFTVKQFKYNLFGANTYQKKTTITCRKNSSGFCSLGTSKKNIIHI